MIKESISAKGSLVITVYDEDLNIKDVVNVNNLVVSVGKNYIASRITSNSTAIMSHMALGSSNTSPVVADTTLGNELGRVALDSSLVTNNVIAYVATFPAGVATGTLKEAGIFNASANGTMLCRSQFSVTKGASDTIVISWNLSIQ